MRFSDGVDRGAGPARHNSLNIVAGHCHYGFSFALFVFFPEHAQILPLSLLFYGVETRLLEFMIADASFHPLLEDVDLLLQFEDIRRQRGVAELGTGSSLVDYVDRFAGQVTIGNACTGV